jgi:predicted flavoprotein YhiN
LIDKLKEIRKNLPNNDASLLLNGFFPKMLAKYILDASKLNLKGRQNKDLDDKELEIIALNIKKHKFNVETKKTSSNCQVMVGGVNLNEVNPLTLESKLHSNLFIGGEVLNIDGQCGGFNLHFAFASGNLIAESISKRIGEQYEKNS